MDERLDRIGALLDAVLARDEAGRDAFLDAECGGDAALREEIRSLMAAHERAGAFLETPAAVAGGFVTPPGDSDVLAGQLLGPYRVEREIGRGGMGVVYLAEDTRLGRKVAVKVLPPEYAADEVRKERLRREARAAAALAHPAIATVFSLEEIDGRLCLVSEFVRGDTLRAEIARGPLPLDLVLDTGVQLARGLAAAHAAGVVHRDLKPDNVIRGLQGEVKILDFGIARTAATPDPGAPALTGAGMAVGTPGYMAPEQLDGAEVDPRTDLFALGILLYELASGAHPFAGLTRAAIAGNVLASDAPALAPTGPLLPPGLDAIVRKCLRRQRAERYASALDLARDLQALRDGTLRGEVLAGRPASPAGPAVGPSSPLWWWRVHQTGAILVECGLVYGAWLAHEAVKRDWTLALLLALIATTAVNGTLRAHLLFTSAFNAAAVTGQFRRATPLVRASDLLVAVLLLCDAAAVIRGDLLLPGTLAALGVGWAVVSLVVEPATRAAAFD